MNKIHQKQMNPNEIYNFDNMKSKKQRIAQELTAEEHSMVQLYQQLTVDQCVELFKKNYDNYGSRLKNRLYVVIGAKIVWGADYVPNKNWDKFKKSK